MSKRIAVVSPSFPPAAGGGVASVHYHLARLLSRAGHIVRGFSFDDMSTGQPDGLACIRRHTPPALARAASLGCRLVFRLLDRGRPAYQVRDIIASYPGAWRLGRHIREFAPDILILPDHGCPGLAIHVGEGTEIVLISHHNPRRFVDQPLAGNCSARDAGFAVRLENRALRGVDRVVCPSTYMRAEFERTYAFDGKVDVVPNLIDEEMIDRIEAHDPRAVLGLPEEAPLVYIPSAGSKLKGSRFVPEIVRRLAGAVRQPVGFFLSGRIPPDMAYELSAMANRARIFVPGPLEWADNIAYVKSCSLAISPTLVENFSMAFLEANCCGLPVVTFDVGGNAELIDEGRSGWVVPLPDVDALIARAIPLLDRRLASEMREHTLSVFKEKFAPERWLGAWTRR